MDRQGTIGDGSGSNERSPPSYILTWKYLNIRNDVLSASRIKIVFHGVFRLRSEPYGRFARSRSNRHVNDARNREYLRAKTVDGTDVLDPSGRRFRVEPSQVREGRRGKKQSEEKKKRPTKSKKEKI